MSRSIPKFDVFGPENPVSPVILSVPHAGRDYPDAMVAAIRVPVEALLPLEDRYIDTVAMAARQTETMIVQRVARAWIDLNRADNDRDPKLDDGAGRGHFSTMTAKARSGLGLVPRRIAGAGEIWRERLTNQEVLARIDHDHRPYHTTLGRLLAAARARFGIAVLLDIHSMPPLAASGDAARIVFGDRFGKSASARFIARLEDEATAAGLCHALNTPYSGGHILDRHARPRAGIHAIQIEFDRTLYLDDSLRSPGPGAAPIACLLQRMVAAVTDEATIGTGAIAAE